jgi:hypothetical protein
MRSCEIVKGQVSSYKVGRGRMKFGDVQLGRTGMK